MVVSFVGLMRGSKNRLRGCAVAPVVGRKAQGEVKIDVGQAAVLEFGHSSDGLGPAEALLDLHADALVHRVGTVTGGAAVNCRTPVGVVNWNHTLHINWTRWGRKTAYRLPVDS